MFSLLSLMLRIVFNLFAVMFVKTSLLLRCFCIRLFVANLCLSFSIFNNYSMSARWI